MKIGKNILAGLLAGGFGLAATASERRFTYTYEPEAMPQGTTEFEQWVSLGTQRTSGGEVRQANYNQWQLRSEIEYGVTDNYTVGVYLNTQAESYRDVSVSPASNVSETKFNGVSVENRYLVWNPANHAVGLTLYLEPTFAGDQAELEQKIIFGQRHGDWKWALNFTHATGWKDNFHQTEGEFETTFGLTRDLNPRWSLGFEFRNHNEIPEYNQWKNTAFFLGPVVSYRHEKWWATLSVMPQIYGANFQGNPDNNTHFELEGHERVNLRLIFGIEF